MASVVHQPAVLSGFVRILCRHSVHSSDRRLRRNILVLNRLSVMQCADEFAVVMRGRVCFLTARKALAVSRLVWRPDRRETGKRIDERVDGRVNMRGFNESPERGEIR